MAQVSEYRPKLAYKVGRYEEDPSVLTTVSGFSPSLPDDINWGVNEDEPRRSDAEVQDILSNSVLYTAGLDGTRKRIADRIGRGLSMFISPAFRDLLEQMEPGRHRYFDVTVKSRTTSQDLLDHGTYYWLRPLPVVDCVLFPQTKTVADWKGKPWSKAKSRALWGGGVDFGDPVYIDASKVEGHHFWGTLQSNRAVGNPQDTIFTWSATLVAEYRKRGLTGWEIGDGMHLVYGPKGETVRT